MANSALGYISGHCIGCVGWMLKWNSGILCSHSVFFAGGVASCLSPCSPVEKGLVGRNSGPDVSLEVKPAPGWPLETALP